MKRAKLVCFMLLAHTALRALFFALANVRNALKGTDTEEVKKKTQALVQTSMKLGEAVYKNQQKDS